jgi:glycosyltransferase involved in cell wall biosynthesis
MLTDAVVALGVARDRTLTVPLGVDAALFAARKPRAAATAPLVVSTRRLEPVYDVETTIAAAAGAARSHAFTLEIAGDGSLRPLLQRSIAVDSMRGRVTFHGELNEARIADLLARADVYVSSSLSDSTSVSLLEAMSAGAFPVVSDVAANREWIIDGETGLLFPPGDAEALSRALARALDDGALRARAAERNRAVILARAARERCMRAVEEALCALARTT